MEEGGGGIYPLTVLGEIFMKKSPFFWAFLVMVAAGGIYSWQLSQVHTPPPMPTEQPLPLPVPPSSGEPQISHPVIEPAPETEKSRPELGLEGPLPSLDQADGRLAEIFAKLFGPKSREEFFVVKNFIQRFVIMVDTLPNRTLPAAKIPVKKIAGDFLARGRGEALTIDPANYRRYTPFVRLAETVDKKPLVAVYSRFYPLFQQAYEDLGYPHGYFNDRLIEVIDHLLAAPRVPDPIRLVRPKVRYQFADSEMEAYSAGWKVLIRTGPENAERIKQILRDYRDLLTGVTGKN